MYSWWIFMIIGAVRDIQWFQLYEAQWERCTLNCILTEKDAFHYLLAILCILYVCILQLQNFVFHSTKSKSWKPRTTWEQRHAQGEGATNKI